ncbi:MAG: hypothetical protein GYA51_11950 [Candidatus Methanofastidiosa archaeon]|nr:hypothetical protein [Candidatus Methanofastidiosa archaeon]
MNRAGFLKSIFGAAVVAAMPKVVVEEIEKIPTEEITPTSSTVLEWHDVVTEFKIPNGNRLFLYNDKQLIAVSTHFAVEFTSPKTIDVNISPFDEFPSFKYLSDPPCWKVQVDQLHWFNDNKGIDYFSEKQDLQVVLSCDNLTVNGNAYITEYSTSINVKDNASIIDAIELTGYGIWYVNCNNR